MKETIIELSNALNFIKGFDSGYTSRVDDALLVKRVDKVYRVVLEEVECDVEELEATHIKKYLR